jgi:phosphate transport system substrate-binding protein
VYSKQTNSRLRNLGTLAIATTCFMAATSAMAAEKLYGGGATFPSPAYVGEGYLATTPDARLSTNAGNNAGAGFQTAVISPGSVFAAYTAATTNQISYCQTGSGFGKTALNGSVANLACRDYGPLAPAGLSAAAATPDFTATDSPISGTDYSNFIAGPNDTTRTGIVQIPTLAGAIALPYHDSVNSVPVVNLTTEQVCKIFSGQIKNWSGILNGSTPVGSGNIRIVYRSDGSGTTFAFTSYLASRCNSQFGVPASFFTPNQVFTSAITGGVAIYAASTGASGNNGVVSQTKANSNAIGYADFGEVDSQAARFATVNGYNPAQFGNVAGVPTPVSITTALLRGQVLNGATTAAAPAAIPAAARNCLLLINPTTTISNRYPIAAFTYLNGYYAGNGSVLHIDAIKKLYRTFYNLPVSSRPVLPAGFAYLDGFAAFGNQIRNIIDGASGEPGCVF